LISHRGTGGTEEEAGVRRVKVQEPLSG